MNLPKAVKIKDEEKMKLNVTESSERIVVDQPMSAAQTSNNMLDVEYEEGAEYGDDLFNGLASMAQQHQPDDDNQTIVVRDYSIDTWNGSPGLKAWGYDENHPERWVFVTFKKFVNNNFFKTA